MIRIKALNESSLSSEDEYDDSDRTPVTREAQEEHLQSLYFGALKLINSDKDRAKKELVDLLQHLNRLDKNCGINNVDDLKYLALKNLGYICSNSLDYFLDALAIDDRDVPLWIETGKRAFYQFLNFPLARYCFEQSLKLSPANWIIIDTLVSVYFILKDFTNCFDLCIKALSLDSGYFKGQLILFEILRCLPFMRKDLPAKFQWVLNWEGSTSPLGRKIFEEFSTLKEKRKRKFAEDVELAQAKKRKYSLTLDRSILSLQSLGLQLKKILQEVQAENYSMATVVNIVFETGSDEISSTEESISDDNAEREKPKTVPRQSFPFEFLDKRRSTRVQRIQNKSNDSFELSSDNIYEKIYSMIPKSIMVREGEFKPPDSSDTHKSIENPDESNIIERFLSKQKAFKLKGKRLSSIIDDLLLEISSNCSSIKVPSYFMDFYHIHRSFNELPSPVMARIDYNISLEELKLILTALEIEYNKKEANFLNQMLPVLKGVNSIDEYNKFFIRLLVIRGSKECEEEWLREASEFMTLNGMKSVSASNKVVYQPHLILSLINTIGKNSLHILLDQQKHEELIEILISKPELSDDEEMILCKAIEECQDWQRGVDIISTSKNPSDQFLKTLKVCLKNKQDLIIHKELTVRLLKMGTEKYSALAWACLLNVIANEVKDKKDEKKVIESINVVHQFLGKKGLCTQSNGQFLLFALDFFITQCNESKDDLILQCFQCLYRHPPRKIGSSHMQPHSNSPQVYLKWENADLIYSYFVPEELPEFDSLRRVSIDSDTELLLGRILPLIPENLNPMRDARIIDEYLKTGKPMSGKFSTHRHHLTQNLYYFLADYYFKNKEFQKARDFYVQDLALNRDRFDSWAACALSISHLIDQTLIRGDDSPTAVQKICQLADSASRCFKEALKIEPENIKIWIEFGTIAYNVASYVSRLRKSIIGLNGEEYVKREKELDKIRKKMLTEAKTCFKSADQTNHEEERWLHYYFLGKIAEKMNSLEALRYYELSDLCLATSSATYPRKIGYHNPSKLSIEALEIHYRIHACTIKYLRTNPKVSHDDLCKIKVHLLKALRTPFARQIQHSSPTPPDHDYLCARDSSSNQKFLHISEDVREVVDDLLYLVEDEINQHDDRRMRAFLMELSLEAMHRCLQRFPNHYKSLYRLAHHFYSINDFFAARIVLLGRFTASATGAKFFSRKSESHADSKDQQHEQSKSEPILGLFAEHKNNNLFNGIWRIPVDDIDRPGSFSAHMYRSTLLLIKISSALSDLHRLSSIALQLSKTPDAGKKYLRDPDRIRLAREAVGRCFVILKNKMVEAVRRNEDLDAIKNELRKVTDKLMKCSTYHKETSVFLIECDQILS